MRAVIGWHLVTAPERRPALFCLGLLVLLCLPLSSLYAQQENDESWQQARAQYQLARQALDAKDYAAYQQASRRLQDYPLYPYLEYDYLRQHLAQADARQIQDFVSTYRTTPPASALQQRWLRHLATTGQWTTFLQTYDEHTASTELRCYALWARHQSGDAEAAFSEVPDLWLVGYSQPAACDPIFDAWLASGRLQQQMAWQRFQLALQRGNLPLARYVERLLDAERKQLAKRFRQLYQHPERLQETADFRQRSPDHRDMILIGFERLVHRDVMLAYELWPQYQSHHRFHASEIRRLNRQLMFWLAYGGHRQAYEALLERAPEDVNDKVLEAGIRLAITQQDWPRLLDWSARLSPAARQLNQHRYWLLRAQLASGTISATDLKPAFKSLASERDYYGFLAAEYLQQPYRMNHKTYAVDGNFLEQLKVMPGIIRARELWLNGESRRARWEWYRIARNFNEDQHYTAAHLARQIGWHSQAIRSTINAKRWHDLSLRFPVLYEQAAETAAHQYQLNANWVLAMARQESAMTADAISAKGAMGLIQMLPDTAQQVARQHRIDYRHKRDLLVPETNIQLASAYLAGLRETFANPVYATAAYNAGPHRVKQWLADSQHLPLDIWVEQIPYAETRQYVKNVLTYSAIIAHRRNQSGYQMAIVDYLPPSKAP